MAARLYGIIAKEFIQLWRDGLALFVPVAMLFIFGWAINTDVKHVTTAVFDQSGGVEARTRLIDSGEAKVGPVIPPDFARQLSRRRASVLVVVDASDPQVATSAMNAATALAADRSLTILAETTEGVALKREAPPLDFRVRAWYNPDLVSAIFIVPGLIGALLMQTTITAMAVSVVRER